MFGFRIRRTLIAILGATLAVGVMAFSPAAPALASAQTGSAAGIPFDLGPSPVGLPSNCPFANSDANFVFQNGTFVSHGVTNKNGDWFGITAEGPAVFSEDTTALYQGHLTIWFGVGNNAKAQTENGFTLDYHGTGPGGSLAIHVDGHTTTNAGGTTTATPQHVHITCS
jgi:hypothetical protein